jgi:hypothetical protein
MLATRTLLKIAPMVGMGGGMVGGALLFLHLMQTNATVNEAVGNISPTVAGLLGCSCPFCSTNPKCMAPANQIGVARLDTTQINTLLGR